MTLLKIPGRLWSYCWWAGDPFQWLWSCQPSYHSVWQVLGPSKGVGSACACGFIPSDAIWTHSTTMILVTSHLLNCFFFWHPLHSFAYIEFSDRDSVTSAIGLHETLFRGRVLKVRSIKTTWWCWRKTQTVGPCGRAHTGYCSLNCIKCTVYLCVF